MAMPFRRFIAITTLAALLSACSVGPNYRPVGAGALGVPDGYSIPAAPSAQDLSRWWTSFDDPELVGIVERARVGNLDVAQAVARLRQAREQLIQSRAGLFPTVNGSAGYNRAFTIAGGTTNFALPDGSITTVSQGGRGSSFSLGLDASYQAGIFGEVRRTIEASRAQQAASAFDYANVVVSVESEAATNYITARLAQAQLANARASLAIQDDNLQIARFRVQAGLVSSLDVEQARATRAQTAATIPQLGQQYAQAVARVAVLTGQAPGALRAELAAVRPIPRAPVGIAARVPADTLRRRPDVRAAERTLAAATAQIGVAKAQLYPALAITGNVQANAANVGNLLQTITGSVFAGLTQAIFNGGRLRSQVRGAQAAAEGALAAYRSTVLTGLEDVENALVARQTAIERERDFAEAFDAANNSAILSRSQYRSGLTDFTTLNTAEAQLVTARNGLAQARGDEATAAVQLFTALGGGWDPSVMPQPPITGPH